MLFNAMNLIHLIRHLTILISRNFCFVFTITICYGSLCKLLLKLLIAHIRFRFTTLIFNCVLTV